MARGLFHCGDWELMTDDEFPGEPRSMELSGGWRCPVLKCPRQHRHYCVGVEQILGGGGA